MDRSWFPTVAGILDVLAGVPALLLSLGLAIAAAAVGFARPDGVPVEWVQGLLVLLAALALLLAALAVLGGTFAIRRASFAWALAGAIAATVCLPPVGIVSIVLTVVAERELRAGRGASGGSSVA